MAQFLLGMAVNVARGRNDSRVFIADALMSLFVATGTHQLSMLGDAGKRQDAWGLWCLLVFSMPIRFLSDVFTNPTIPGAAYLDLAYGVCSMMFMVDFPLFRETLSAYPMLPMVVRVWWRRFALAIAGMVVVIGSF
jgi:hypothetical protein